MRNNTPATLLAIVQALQPGVKIVQVTKKPDDARRTVDEWQHLLEEAGMWDVPYTDPMWMGGNITFYFADASFIHIKM